MDDTQKIITDQLEKLPANVRSAILAADYHSKLQAITKDNKLMIDQAGKLEMETTLVMLGLEPLDDYTNNLMNNAGFTKNQAIAVAHDVNETIFKSIRDSLKKINDEAVVADATGNPATKGVWQPTNQPTATQPIPVAEKPEETENDLLPEIAPVAGLPSNSILTPKVKPYHENISPVKNIVETKMTEPVVVPKETVVVQEQSRLPEKNRPSDSTDPYREPVI